MTLALKNAGATYQKAIQKCLKSQIEKNMEASSTMWSLRPPCKISSSSDLTETFTNLHTYQWKLNPTKYVFGVPFGLLLGFMVGHRGIEASQDRRNMQHGQTI
jgi:hypothetical protein